MTAVWLPALPQAVNELPAQLDRLVLVQTVMAGATVAVALMALAVALGALLAIRRVTRTIASMDRAIQRLSPRAEPILDKAAKIAGDLGEISGTIRRDFDDVHETIDRASKQLRAAAMAAEERVRDFGLVLQVVQEEAEELLLDTAATARGLHTTAAALRDAKRERLEQRRGAGSRPRG